MYRKDDYLWSSLVELGMVIVPSRGKGDMRYSFPAIFTFGHEQVERNMQIPARRDNFINNGERISHFKTSSLALYHKHV